MTKVTGGLINTPEGVRYRWRPGNKPISCRMWFAFYANLRSSGEITFSQSMEYYPDGMLNDLLKHVEQIPFIKIV